MSTYEAHSKASPRPWKPTKDDSDLLDADGISVFHNMSGKELGEYMIECVNEHDLLVAEVERLKQEIHEMNQLLGDILDTYNAGCECVRCVCTRKKTYKILGLESEDEE